MFLLLDCFEDGTRHLKEDNTKLAELSFSKALRILSGLPNSSHFKKEKSQCFHAMAEIYLSRASQQSDDDDFCDMVVKSIALSEAERIYKHGSYREDEKIDATIEKVDVMFIKRIFGPAAVECFAKIGCKRVTNQKKLDEIRSKITNEYFPALAECPVWNSEDEKDRCSEIESIYQRIHEDIKYFLVDILLYCREIAGPAPGNFAVIGLGSFSRSEVTPYSDLEFSILIDENGKCLSPEQRQYFRFMTYLMQIQIIKLGETILPSLGIPSLNDFYSKNKKDDWFYDVIIPKGLSFDGTMPWASKTPLGRKEWRGQPRQDYIMTIDEMLELQNVNPGSFIESLKTANVFSSVCHLFGDEELTKTYQQRLSALLIHPDRKKTFQQQVLEVMESILATCRRKGIVMAHSGTQQDVKKEVYRLTSLLIEQLSKFFGIFRQSSWQCVRELSKKKILTEDGANNFLAALSITTELRLKCYQQQGRQKDALPTVPQLSVTEEKSTVKNIPTSPTRAIVRLYQTLIPLKSAISQILKDAKNSIEPESLAVAVLQRVNFLSVSPTTTATAYLRILDLPKALSCLLSTKDCEADRIAKGQILLTLAQCYRMVGKFQETIEYCGEVQNLYEATEDIVERRYLLKALIMTMNTFVDQSLYDEALKLYEQIENKTELHDFFTEELDFPISSAVLFMHTNQSGKAERLLRSIIDKLPEQQRYYFDHFACLNNLAAILFREKRVTEAKNLLDSALQYASELYGENAAHPFLARCLTHLAKVHYYLLNLEEADRFLQLALIIHFHIYEHQMIESSIVDALITKARIYQLHKRWTEMFESLNRAKEIAWELYKSHKHPSIASLHFYLGRCEQERGNFSEACNHFLEYLKIHKDRRIECKRGGHDCDTAAVLIRVANLGAQCSFDASCLQSCIERALEIEENIHGKGSNHCHLAMCFGALGYYFIRTDDKLTGLEYLSKAMQMFERIDLENGEIHRYRELPFGKILGEHSRNRAEQQLRTAEGILKKILNDNSHVMLLQISSFLLLIFLDENRIEDSQELAKQQRYLIEATLSQCSSPSLLQLCQLFRLCMFYEESGRKNTAKVIYIDLIKRLEEASPNESEKDYVIRLLCITQQRVGTIYLADQMFDDAEAMFQRILSSGQKTISRPPYLKEAHNIALCHLASIFAKTKKKRPRALQLLDDLISIYENELKSIDGHTASLAFQTRGELYRQCKQFKLALEDLEKALKLVELVLAAGSHNFMFTKPNELYYADVMNSIGLVYEDTNDLKRALEYFEFCVSTFKYTRPNLSEAAFLQNMADILKKLGRLDDVLLHYKESLEIRKMLHSDDLVREDIATLFYHIALTYQASERYKDAFEALEKLLPLRKELLKKGDDDSLQNYSAVLVLKGNCHIEQPGEAQQAKDSYEEAEKVLLQKTKGEPNLDYAVIIGNTGQ